MPRAVSSVKASAYDWDFSNLGRLRQRLLADSRVQNPQLEELLDHIDKVMVGIRPFISAADESSNHPVDDE